MALRMRWAVVASAAGIAAVVCLADTVSGYAGRSLPRIVTVESRSATLRQDTSQSVAGTTNFV